MELTEHSTESFVHAWDEYSPVGSKPAMLQNALFAPLTHT